MKTFIIEMFQLNQDANLKMVSAVSKLPDPGEGLRHLSHLANCQYKWLDRIKIFPEVSKLDWWEPTYTSEDLPGHFIESSQQWITFLSALSDEDIEAVKQYAGFDESTWEAKLKDIALQLIFHSFHHRAQIQMMIRAQGLQPKFIDYIGYKSKKRGVK